MLKIEWPTLGTLPYSTFNQRGTGDTERAIVTKEIISEITKLEKKL